MFRFIFILTFLISLPITGFSQDEPQAYKFDEFGSVQESIWKEKLDKFSEMLISLPDSRLHIIVYAESGKSRTSIGELIQNYQNYLYKTKKVKWESFSFIRGGFRKSQTTELWVIPKNAKKPTPTPTEKFKAELYKEFTNPSDTELKEIIVKVQDILGDNDDIISYIITYGKSSEISNSENRIRNSIRRCGYSGQDCSFIFVNGGTSKNLKTEIWLVPRDAEFTID
ncbi:MAG: hypothetical protein M3405_17410 [Acidobacteriota bacterium]|jgi:hypothetical protein|nr:hypothetical protein [Acidobacteriota bacterium]